ncbi:MAG: hypothetical protein NTW42_01905 [Deltaproteobacteria bacterium]|nr:hypothetical protein [Deltaproteobacteria bacterium]
MKMVSQILVDEMPHCMVVRQGKATSKIMGLRGKMGWSQTRCYLQSQPVCANPLDFLALFAHLFPRSQGAFFKKTQHCRFRHKKTKEKI